ncbi:MAG: ASKHA domain-containing protein [Thermodesulfovibrionales bacterium]
MRNRPLAEHLSLVLEGAAGDSSASDVDRLRALLAPFGLRDVSIPAGQMKDLPAAMRTAGGRLDIVLGYPRGRPRLLAVGGRRVFGVAVDLGSTNLSGCLVDLSSGSRLCSAETRNPQVPYGKDVLTRVHRAMSGDADGLTLAMRTGVNVLISDLCSGAGIPAQDVVAVTVSGNTIMTHFFLGLDVTHIPVAPYTPVVSEGVFLRGAEAGLATNEEALVYVFPNCGSYVGGDIVSGMLAAGIHREEHAALFIDVGTNAEVVLGCREWIMAGAGAAGPALEGDIAEIGRTSGPGTIRGVRINPADGSVDLDVEGGGEPAGICASGVIELVSGLFRSGIIDASGRFVEKAPGVEGTGDDRGFLVARTTGRRLVLREREIQNFLRSKAAMFSFLYVFVRAVGMRFSDLEKVFVAGALGCGIDLDHAIAIGLLPDIPKEKFVGLGNASLSGAEALLLNRDLLQEIETIRGLVTYRQMSEDRELMSVFQGALFIPHTDPEMLKG